MLRIEDDQLPGLADLTQERLCAITGADEVELLRLRYREGKRAILHVAARSGAISTEGTLWFFRGDKAERLARRNKATARFDPEAQVLFEAFPNDHRMPQIRAFLARHEAIVGAMTGRRPDGAPVLLRYRPGLSCTFRCRLDDRSTVFVKLVNDDDPARLLAANRGMSHLLTGSGVGVAEALGIDASVGAISYAGAAGDPLDSLLATSSGLSHLDRATGALRSFWRAPIGPQRRMCPETLLERARESAGFVAVTAPGSAAEAAALVAGLEASVPEVPLRPIHGDMKLEHLFLDHDGVTLIDTESVALGLPDYDLAQLLGRLEQAEFKGQLPRALVDAAALRLRAQAGPAFDWCRKVVALRLAKYYAQRPAPGLARSVAAVLERLR